MTEKVTEANKHISKAEKYLITTCFKGPDYDSAIEYYKKAALILRSVQKDDVSAELYRKVADLYFETGSYFHCAEHYEIAAQLYFRLKKYNIMSDLLADAGRLLRENGTPDSASYVYERAAKKLADIWPKKAAEFYESSADTCEGEHSYHQAAAACEDAAQLLVGVREFPEGERLLRRAISLRFHANPVTAASQVGGVSNPSAVPQLCARSVLAMILMKLHQDDEVAARKLYLEAVDQWRFGEADASQPVVLLLSAIEKQDGELAAEAIRQPCFRNLPHEYVRMIPQIKLPEVSQPAPSQSGNHGQNFYRQQTATVPAVTKLQQPGGDAAAGRLAETDAAGRPDEIRPLQLDDDEDDLR